MTPTINLETLRLDAGAHTSFEQGVCVMEAVSYISGEPISDHPACVSSVISVFLREWNDSLDDDTRQRLKPYIRQVIGTNTGSEDEETREWLAADWLVRECAPAFLRCAGLTDHAETLEKLAALDSTKRAKSAQKDIDAAWAAAWAAARDAARAAARAAAGDAARAALAPTVKFLQASAFELLDRMIAVGKEAA